MRTCDCDQAFAGEKTRGKCASFTRGGKGNGRAFFAPKMKVSCVVRGGAHLMERASRRGRWELQGRGHSSDAHGGQRLDPPVGRSETTKTVREPGDAHCSGVPPSRACTDPLVRIPSCPSGAKSMVQNNPLSMFLCVRLPRSKLSRWEARFSSFEGVERFILSKSLGFMGTPSSVSVDCIGDFDVQISVHRLLAGSLAQYAKTV